MARRRGRLRVRASVNDNQIPTRISRAIQAALKDAGAEIARDGVRRAKTRIRSRDAIWRRELLNSFKTANVPVRGGRVVTILNVSDHAAPLEHGAEYTTRAPPISALIPWVEAKLIGWTVDGDRLVPGSGSTSDFDPLEGAYDSQPAEFIGTYDMPFTTAENRDRISAAVDHAGTRGDLSGIEIIKDYDPEEPASGYLWSKTDNDGNLIGQEGYFNPDFADDAWISARYEEGNIAGSDIEHMVYHEMTHAMHHLALGELGQLRPWNGWPDYITTEQKKRIADEISNYAAVNPGEFVAEVGAMLLADKWVPHDLLELYADFNGPNIA